MQQSTKLVRDLIPDIISSVGETCSYHIATEEEYRKALYQKLQEEVIELTEKPSLDELSDVHEVLRVIAVLENWTAEQVEAARSEKAEKRGGFSKRIILEKS